MRSLSLAICLTWIVYLVGEYFNTSVKHGNYPVKSTDCVDNSSDIQVRSVVTRSGRSAKTFGHSYRQEAILGGIYTKRGNVIECRGGSRDRTFIGDFTTDKDTSQ